MNNFTLQQWASVPVRGVQGAVPSRGVCVHDLPGTHRDEACFSTASQRSLKPRRETDPGRWSSETPFQAMRAYLRLETPPGPYPGHGAAGGPGLVRAVCGGGAALRPAAGPLHPLRLGLWCGTSEVTFSAAITAGRRWVRVEGVFVTCGHQQALTKLPCSLRNLLLYALAPAA